MKHANALNPTLWRTCRMLAGRTRIRLLRHLLEHPGQNVSAMARAAGIGESDASQELRRLQSRGLLQRKHVGAGVIFQATADPQVLSATPLLKALRQSLTQCPADQDEAISRLAMALGHERRVQIARTLAPHALPLSALRRATGIPPDSLRRHLQRMASGGLVQTIHGQVMLTWPPHPLARALAQLI